MVGKLVPSRQSSPWSAHKVTMTLPEAPTGPSPLQAPLLQPPQGTPGCPPWAVSVLFPLLQIPFLFLLEDVPFFSLEVQLRVTYSRNTFPAPTLGVCFPSSAQPPPVCAERIAFLIRLQLSFVFFKFDSSVYTPTQIHQHDFVHLEGKCFLVKWKIVQMASGRPSF